jgi:hypothetical protein
MQRYRRGFGALRCWISIMVLAGACTSLTHDEDGPEATTDATVTAGDAAIVPPVVTPPSNGDAGRRDGGRSQGGALDAGQAQRDARVTDDACEPLTFYADQDGDAYGDPASASSACAAPAGYVSNGEDCDDACRDCHPGADESCDERDNNCDDTVDEGCACEPGTTRPCGEERGVCEPGTQACSDGTWSDSCEGARGPEPSELCNGLDDDCNGASDDAIPELGSDCSSGVGECARSGKYVCASDPLAPPLCDAAPGTPIAELCANALDEDCDGRADEAPSATSCCVDAHCSASKKCSDGACVDKTGCELRSRPSDVLAADYQCLDFDRSASFSPWTAVTANGGTISLSTDQATSPPRSVYANLSGTSQSEGRLRWTATGPNAIKSVSLSASVHFPTAIGFHELWVGHDELLCIHHSSSSFCVTYAYNEENPGGWGLALEEVRTTSTIETHVCPVVPPPGENVWSRIELRVSSSSVPSVYLNGVALASPECTFTLLTSTSATLEVGMKQTAADESWHLYFDDIEAALRR